MSEKVNWKCPYCGLFTIPTGNNIAAGSTRFNNNNKYGLIAFYTEIHICSNPLCREFTIKSELIKIDNYNHISEDDEVMEKWQLRPQSSAKPLPIYIPQAIKEDYEEACLIQTLSPKASATLARRCLQGMIRDFWEVKPQNLAKEIESIKDKVELDTWEAIDVVRKIGNIGAHMEKDINQIVEVDENEAGLLIGLIEMLIEEWYVSRYERRQRLANIKQLGQDKDTQRKKGAEPIAPN